MQDVKQLERGNSPNGKASAKARLIRNKQATAMLQASLGLSRVIEGLELGVPVSVAVEDLIEIEAYLRATALS